MGGNPDRIIVHMELPLNLFGDDPSTHRVTADKLGTFPSEKVFLADYFF